MKKHSTLGIALLMGILVLSSTKIMRGMNQDENQLGLLEEIKTGGFINHVATGNTAMVMEALESGRIDVNHHDPDGLSALHAAIWYGQPEMAKMLIEEGANVNDRFPTSNNVDEDLWGFTPLMMVVTANEDPNYKQQQREEMEAAGIIATDENLSKDQLVRLIRLN